MTTPAEQKAAARQFAGFWRGKGYEKMTESECVAELFKRYQALVNLKGTGKAWSEGKAFMGGLTT